MRINEIAQQAGRAALEEARRVPQPGIDDVRASRRRKAKVTVALAAFLGAFVLVGSVAALQRLAAEPSLNGLETGEYAIELSADSDVSPETALDGSTRASERLDHYRAVWNASATTSYVYEIVADCECHLGGHLEVEIASGEVIRLVRLDVAEHPIIDNEVGATVEDLFQIIDDAIAPRIVPEGDAGLVEVTYDQELGYPTSFHIVWDPQADDGALRASIIHFEAKP